MRLPLLLLPLTLALPLGAQTFEGTVAMRMSGPDGSQIDVKYAMKGERAAMTMTAPASSGPMAGAEIRMLIDPAAKTMTMLMPIPAGMGGGGFLPPDAKGIKTVMPMGTEAQGGPAGAPPEIKKLGTSQTIAGIKCDDYEIKSDNNTAMVCMASDMARFAYPSLGGGLGGRGRGANAAPAWSKALGAASGFPLKVWTADNKVAMEVTSVQRGPVANDTFEVPAGYVDLGGMMGRGRP